MVLVGKAPIVLLFVAAPVLTIGCGGGDGGQIDPAEPEAAAAVSAVRERPILEFPPGGTPTVTVKRGKSLALYDEPGGKVLERVRDETEWGSPTVFAVSRKRDGWAGVPTAHFENGRLAWVRLDPRRVRAGQVHTAIEIDLSEFRTTFLYKGKPVSTFEVSVGMPEAPTPTGDFAVTDTFRGDLNPAYGCCAVALTARQTRLPSGWLGGDRIAIHGTTGPLGAEISHGCVRALDPNVNELVEKVPPGTPVTIRN